MVLVIVVLPPIILIMIRFCKKKSIKFSNYELSAHCTIIIYQVIINVLHEYNLKRDLENKIFLISFDNASTNIKSIDYFTRALNSIMDGRMFHQKCVCHILSLTVKAGLKTTPVNNLICKFKDDFHHIYSNNIRKQDFHVLSERLNLSKLRIPWDIDTRWNSTYRILHRVLPYKHAISEILCNSPEGLPLLCSRGKWDQLEQLHTFLEVFFNATVQLSCSYTPSAHQLLQRLYFISNVYFLFVFIFLTLAMMARDIFVIYVSTVPSEFCFSSANRILTDKHNRLDAKTFERLIYLKNWFDAKQRNQHAPVEQSSGEFMT
jgi:hAT family C-terminal dimerisation region